MKQKKSSWKHINFIRDHKFSELHVFPYSQRTGTPAARMEDQVDEEIKNERVHRLIALNDQLAKEYASRFEGEVLEVIPEERFKDGDNENLYVGYTTNYLKVIFEGTEEMVGQLVKVKVTKAGYPYSEGQFVTVSKQLNEVFLAKRYRYDQTGKGRLCWGFFLDR